MINSIFFILTSFCDSQIYVLKLLYCLLVAYFINYDPFLKACLLIWLKKMYGEIYGMQPG